MLGRHERLRLEAELRGVAGRESPELARAQEYYDGRIEAECLADATTHWMLFFGFGGAAVTGSATWLAARSRARAATPLAP